MATEKDLSQLMKDVLFSCFKMLSETDHPIKWNAD